MIKIQFCKKPVKWCPFLTMNEILQNSQRNCWRLPQPETLWKPFVIFWPLPTNSVIGICFFMCVSFWLINKLLFSVIPITQLFHSIDTLIHYSIPRPCTGVVANLISDNKWVKYLINSTSNRKITPIVWYRDRSALILFRTALSLKLVRARVCVLISP